LKLLPNFNCTLALFSVLCTLASTAAFGQRNVSGYVLDENNQGIPFANVFVKELGTGTSTDQTGRYFLTLENATYTLVFTSVGYRDQTISVVLNENDVVKNVWLEPSTEELSEIVVKAKRRDPAYEIIQNAIDHKKDYLFQVNTQRNKVYIKATEVISQIEKPLMGKHELEQADQTTIDLDEVLEKVQYNQTPEPSINMIEMELTLNFKAPDRFKEERTAFNSYGSTAGLFIPRFDETDFNFYKNLVQIKGVSEVPVISPLATTSILTYKFKLEESFKEDGQLVYKIRVSPRKAGNSSLSGYIYINDGLWNINRLEFALYKGSLMFYDEFTLKQEYCNINDSLWLACRQEFIYKTTEGRRTKFEGNTLIKYEEYEVNYPFEDKFFGNEIAFTAKEAYDRDSGYWAAVRPEPLKPEEQRMVRRTDSIRAITESPEYLDSVDRAFNKLTWGDLLWDGLAFRKRNRRYMSFSSVPSLIGYQIAGGLRLGPYFFYFKRWESGRHLILQENFDLGLKNMDLQGSSGIRFRYSPMRYGDVWCYVGRFFSSINYNDAYLNQLSFSNYILADHIELGNRIELSNGLFLFTELNFTARQSLEDYDNRTFINDLIGEREPLIFEDYQALITNTYISYTPANRYITEPNRKINLGSRYPTFSVHHKKGWQNLLGSDINFDFLEITVSQKIQMGIFGKSNYTVSSGQFVNTKNLKFIDFKRFRQSDPVLYSNPLYTFQMLDTALAITNLFVEAHYIHHFNGALINNIPLLKKTRINVLAGGGGLWLSDPQYRYAEVFAGIERSFKLGARRRLKLGLYGVVAESSISQPRTTYKVSIDIIDTWKRNWSF